MPWRFIILIVVFAVFLAFITFNLENKCDISFGFSKLSDVPVFITIFASFVLGFFCALPFIMHIKKKRKDKPNDKSNDKSKTPDVPFIEPDSNQNKPIDPGAARLKFLARKKGNVK